MKRPHTQCHLSAAQTKKQTKISKNDLQGMLTHAHTYAAQSRMDTTHAHTHAYTQAEKHKSTQRMCEQQQQQPAQTNANTHEQTTITAAHISQNTYSEKHQ
eukprot:GDKI01036445.1.p3 GENE.GDKI01036445.1~~GDKI01036445.1.p3  ORF type:complete len:101 (+),score=34.54 GDKI01036445.1:76-378(+)